MRTAGVLDAIREATALYFLADASNGKKVTILLEECALPYVVKPVHIGRRRSVRPGLPAHFAEQPHAGARRHGAERRRRADCHLRVGRDHDVPGREGRCSGPKTLAASTTSPQWLMWQMANQGPKMGEQGHFGRAAEEPKNGDQSYGPLSLASDNRGASHIRRAQPSGLPRQAVAGRRAVHDRGHDLLPLGQLLASYAASTWRVPQCAPLARDDRGAAGGRERHGRGAGIRRRPEQAVGRGKGSPGQGAVEPKSRADPEGVAGAWSMSTTRR